GTCNAQFVIINVAVTPNADTLKLEIFETNGKLVVSKIVPFKITDSQIPTDIKIIEAKVPNVKLWSPESTNLYIAKVTLLQNTKPLDVIQTRFGIREFAINGSDFLLNGKKLMLCGYGDDHIYPQEWSFSSDKEMYLKRLRIIRSFGFNFVRHHSAIMPQEYYEACDEIGMIPTAEFPIVYQPFMPGEPYWRAKVPEGTSTEPAFKLYLERWEATIKQLRNHPCIFAWMMGNELGGPLPQFAQLRLDFQRIAKTNDPDRFFCDTDGGDWKGYFDDPKNNRDTLDFVSYQFDEWCSPILDTNKFILSKQQKPTLSHESGNYITFTRPDEIELYETSNFKPFWMVEGKVKLEQLGLLKEANNWAVASEKLYLLHHKYNLESLRKVPTISGYTWWLFQDYWTTSNGLVDTNFRLKSIKPEEVLPFNSPVVLLQNGLERTYRSGEKFKATLWGSNYSSGNLTGKMLWKLSTNDKIISENSFDIPVTEQGLLNTLGEAETVLPKTELPVEITFSLQLDSSDGNCCKNSWATWLFPKNPVPKIDQTPVYIDHTSEEKCPRFTDWKFQPIPDTKKLPAHAVYVVSWLTPAVGDALERGAGVILLGHITTIPDIEIRYQQTWWKGGDSNDKNHVGTYIYDNPITKEMAPDHWGNIAWAKLLEGAVKFNFETAPATPEIIVRALPSLVCVQNTALLYKVGVGKGTLIVSGLNHVKANECPENDWIMKQMVENVAQFSPPAAQWSTEFCFPKPEAPDGMIVGFRNILSQKYEESIGPSYRSQKAKFFICRQTSDKNILEWETENIPKNIDTDNVTLIFAGGLGFEPEPKTEGFEFLINDKVVLKFDLPEPTEWKSEDGKTVLKLHVKKSTQADTWGVFTLIVPKDFFEQGEVLKLGVRSLGKESRRWFGLNPLFDLKNDL
ncbi:MAG: hypothetical protein LBP87_12615, partial [Planctomycetaceae bacterium]|nr:hypothetical protein [Planctomycetaceae bacterium]